MNLKPALLELASKLEKQKSHASTEEAVKTAFILPVIQTLGYEVFNPAEVIPEFTADHGIRKNEKVDYAIALDGEIRILVEAKQLGEPLEAKHAGQLFRYFAVTDARLAILTDGIRYLFYADLEKPNQMDDRPFFEFDFANFSDQDVAELSKFTKDAFDVDNILGSANNLKYLKALGQELKTEFSGSPSEELVRLFASRVYDGRITAQVKDDFTELLQRAFDTLVKQKIQSKLDSAFNSDPIEEENSPVSTEIETTDEELDGYRITQAIVAEVADPQRVFIRDAKSYCAVLFDDNNRKSIIRLHFNTKQKYVEIMDDAATREPIDSVVEIYKFRARIQSLVKSFL